MFYPQFFLKLLLQCSSVESLEAIAELLTDIIGKSSAWILDIDLDFYSTGNPYRSLFNNVRNNFKDAVDINVYPVG